MLKRMQLLLALLATLVAVGVVATATPATASSVTERVSVVDQAALPAVESVMAARALGSCPNGTGCVWSGVNYSGDIKVISVSAHQVNQCYNFSTAWDNRVDSVHNRYGAYGGYDLYLYLYYDQGCSGSPYAYAPGTYSAATPPNVFSSFKIKTV